MVHTNQPDKQPTESEKKIRMMIRRRITGIILAVVLCALWTVQGWPLRIGFVCMMVMSIWEMYGAFEVRGARPIRWIGIAYALAVVPAYLRFGMQALMPLMALCLMLGLGGVILRGEIDFDSAVATLFPLLYPGCLITLFFPIMDLQPRMHSSMALGLLFLVALMNDLFAYEVGMRIGKRPLAPALSPKKTIEGCIAGLCASLVFAVLIPFVAQLVTTYVPPLQQYAAPLPPYWLFALLGVVGGVAAQIGDLTASMVKRYCGVKDFGAIFPGHGGMLDRIDSVLFNGVVVYVFLAVIWTI